MEEKNTKEVNLLDIMSVIWNWIVKVVMFVISLAGKTLQLLFRHKILTIILLLLAFAVSQYFSRPSNRKYNVDAMAVLYGVQAKTVMQVGSQLTASSPRFEETSLSRKLGISDSVSKKIAGINFFNVIDFKSDSVPDRVDFNNKHPLSDTLNVRMRDHVYIRLKTIGTKHAAEVGDAVLKYINSNPTVQTEFESWKNQLRQSIVIAGLESKRLDSLARIKYFQDAKPNIRLDNNNLLIGNQYTQLFYGDMLYMQRIISESEAKLAEAETPLVIPSGFIINPQATNGRVKNGIEGLLIGLVLSVIAAFVIENFKNWIKFLNQK